ncbi:MAG TPA: CHAD domain-containing protein [Thermoanaerobaculia bacterium]|nr:CHAD domain-containing protein [Thermoanaerobaculia bacterium]
MVDVERRRSETIPARSRLDRRREGKMVARARKSATPSPVARDRGRTPGRAAPRRRYTPPALDPGSRADTSTRLLLHSLLEALRSQEEGVGRHDPEALHDFRVALRRARCLLGQVRGVLPRGDLDRLRADLNWLGKVTGPARDCDVLLERLESSRRALAPDERTALAPVTALVRRERHGVRRELQGALGSTRYRRLLDEWERVASEPGDGSTSGEDLTTAGSTADAVDGARPTAAIAAEAIERAWRRLVRRGRAVSESSPAEAYHRVRIDGKKLRYLLELHQSAYPGVDLGATLSASRRLQDCLGKLNDATVHEQALRHLGHSLASSGAAADTLLLTGRLMERTRVAATEARSRFADRFAPLTAKDNRRRIRALQVR